MKHKRIWLVSLVALMLAAAACTCAPLSDITGDFETIVGEVAEQITAEAVVVNPPADNSGGDVVNDGGNTTGAADEGLGGPVYDGGDGYDTTYVGSTAIGASVVDSIPSIIEAHNWQFYGAAGDDIAIRADAIGESDPRITLIGPGGNVIDSDDDSGGDLSAYLLATLTEDGIYTVRVDMWSSGDFALSIDAIAEGVGIGPSTDNLDDGNNGLGGPNYDGGDGFDTTYVGSLQVGESVVDSIPTLFEAHNWQFEGSAGQTVTIRADVIGDSDPRIKLIDPNGTVIGEDDDGGGDYSSLLTVTLPVDGMYTIRVDMWTEGEFTLSIQ